VGLIIVLTAGGGLHYGSYTVDHEYLTVNYGMEAKTTIIDPYHGNPEALAVLLLSELVSQEKKHS
jgi:hypothetical protein